MNKHIIAYIYTILFFICAATVDAADTLGVPLLYRVELNSNAGRGDFAPYYIASNVHGVVTQSRSTQLRFSAWKNLELNRRFSWSAGVDVVANTANMVDYMRFDVNADSWYKNAQRPTSFWVQQLYGQLKWRSAFIIVGLKQHQSALLNSRLASGDLVESGNARPIPEVRAGLIDFRNIPFTNGWVQVQGELAYGKPTDNGWLRNHYNYYNHFITQGSLYHYKRIYFRTRPDCRLSVTLGMQAAAQFSGTRSYYMHGDLIFVDKEPFKLIDLLDMLITRTDDSYYKGNHVGSWDMKARYRLDGNNEICAYFQWPWEDGSGIGKLNGFDGTWGIEWKKSTSGYISGAVAELLYFMNHSGPIHCDPDDLPGTNFPVHTDGADDYYNNAFYNGYAYYGMGIGSPVFPLPLYNTDGFMRYVDTRLRGFHLGISGEFRIKSGHDISYRLLCGYREAFGSAYLPRKAPVHNTSIMAELNWRTKYVPGLSVNACIGVDRGTIYGDNTGVRIGACYAGNLSFGKFARK